MTTLKCTECPVIFEGEIVSSIELHTSDPELDKLMDKTGCPECGAPMHQTDTLNDGYRLDDSLAQWLAANAADCEAAGGCDHEQTTFFPEDY